MQRIIFLLMAISLTGCLTRKSQDPTNGSNGSDLAEANVGFPDKSKFGNNASKLTGFYLDIQPSATSCKGALTANEAYVTSKKFEQKIQQGCDYTFVAEVGEFDATAKKLKTVYFSNRIGANKGKKLTAAEFKGKDKFAVVIQLDVTEDGKKAGFTGSPSTMTETDLQIEVQFGEGNKTDPNTENKFDEVIVEAAKIRDSLGDKDLLTRDFNKKYEKAAISGVGVIKTRNYSSGYVVLEVTSKSGVQFLLQLSVNGGPWVDSLPTVNEGQKIAFVGRLSFLSLLGENSLVGGITQNIEVRN